MKKEFFNMVLLRVLIVSNLILLSIDTFAQYDTVHYIPPFYSRTNSTLDLGRSYLHLSTNVMDTFIVNVVESDGSLIMNVQISRDTPKKIWLGYQYNCIGIVDSTGLNTPLVTDGIIAKANFPFFANIRHSSDLQGMSLTAKGSHALGTRFRSGHMYTTKSGPNDVGFKSHMISVMAVEDNTVITFSDIKPGVIFHGTPTVGNTSEDIVVTLNKYESYIIATHLDEPFNNGNDTLVNGVLIESTRPIVVNSGSWTGGSDQVNNLGYRDIGMDQIVPVELTGTKYILSKRYSYLPEECERVIVIADKDETEVFINGSTSPIATLQSGEFFIVPAYFFNADNLMSINTSLPVYVYQTTNGSPSASYTLGMNFIPPITCSGLNEVTIHETDSFNGATASIDIIAKSGSTVWVNNNTISSSAIMTPGNTEWEVYKLSGITGDINIKSDNNVYVSMTTSMGARGAAGYFSGFSDRSLNPDITSISYNGGKLINESCIDGQFVITKPAQQINKDITYYYLISGTALNGVDFTFISDSIFIPAGQTIGSIDIDAHEDGIDEGQETIILTLYNSEICNHDSTLSATLVIEENASIDFSIENSSGCSPLSSSFTMESSNNEFSSVYWDFGDGSFSTELNPVHEYQTPGFYSVALYVLGPAPCYDTLYVLQEDAIYVEETPVAGFTLDTDYIDACNSKVQIFSDAQGATEFLYDFNEPNSHSSDEHPSYTYQNDGSHYITQVVFSDHGCSDTSIQEIYVEPFNLFAPNTFTPDGDKYNNVFNVVVDLELYEWHLTIMNRWGEILFESYDISKGWNGSYFDGSIAQDGTYQWIAEYISCSSDNIRKRITGHVNLIK